jgi:predicted transcriptional regulator
VRQTAQYLREKQVRAVGVVNASGKLVGVISHSDVSDKVAAENKCPAWMKASDIMTRELITVTPEMTVEDCLRLVEQNTIFHLIVLDGQRYIATTRRPVLTCWSPSSFLSDRGNPAQELTL